MNIERVNPVFQASSIKFKKALNRKAVTFENKFSLLQTRSD